MVLYYISNVKGGRKMKNKQKILKELALDFAKYDYYGHYFVFRVDKKTGENEMYDPKQGWVKSEGDIVKRASNIFEGGMDIDVILEGDEDYAVELAEDYDE